MRAIRQEVLGGPDVLREVEVERPEPGLSQILVQVRAAGVNPSDWAHRAHRVFLGEPPFTLGWDVSGVVESVGFGVTLFKPGDEVFGMLPYPFGVGSHADVIGTASERNHDLVRSLGADEVIDYAATDFSAAASDIDVVLDPIAGDYSARSLRVLRTGGTLVSLLPFAPDIPGEAARLGVRAEVMLVEYDHQGMTVIADLVTRGKLRPVIAATFPLADAAKAHVRGETGHVAGKIVLTMPLKPKLKFKSVYPERSRGSCSQARRAQRTWRSGRWTSRSARSGRPSPATSPTAWRSRSPAGTTRSPSSMTAQPVLRPR